MSGEWLIVLLLACVLAACHPAAGASGDVPLTAEERAWLDQHSDELVLYYNVEFPPIEYQSEAGTFVGMGADVTARVAQLLGVTFSEVPSSDWNDHLQSLESGACAIAPTIVKTADREEYAFFTKPYATVPVVIITSSAAEGRTSLGELAGMKVGVVSGFATETYLADKALVEGFTVVPVANVPEGLQAVSFGELDAFVENLAVAAYYIEKDGIPNLRVAGTTDYSFAWSIAVSREYPLLYSSLEKALEQISDDELDGIRKKWISLDVEMGISPETLLLLELVGLFLTLLAVSLVIITYVLKKRLDQKLVALEQSEAKYRRLAENSPAAVYQLVMSPEGEFSFSYMSELVYELTGYTAREVMADASLLLEGIHDDDEAQYQERVTRSRDRGERFRHVFRFVRDSRVRWIEAQSSPEQQADGSVVWDGFFQDVTDRIESEQHRARLQEQLIHSHKMESIGRLAGGVAHDFNNLLSVILGHAELGMAMVSPSDPLASNLGEILDAAKRSANLTRQLLAFARKQTVSPVILDLDETVGSMLTMLGRLIGEQIALVWRPAGAGAKVEMDPAQLDQILANLVVNARDAIEGTGTVVIETATASYGEGDDILPAHYVPGAYATLTVSDDGRGMTEAERSHLFEPFFTTKEVGKGTGLGLATVYGIVTQNEGFVTVESKPGKGSALTIHLPIREGHPEPHRHKAHHVPPVAGTATILLAEDEPSLLSMTSKMLTKLGYSVIGASSGEEALGLVEEQGVVVHLLVTDVVMPGMNGRELSAALRSRWPGLRCLYMSGYTADVIAPHGVLDEGVDFIQKPFSFSQLARKIATILERT